jgi:hypothetical protein
MKLTKISKVGLIIVAAIAAFFGNLPLTIYASALIIGLSLWEIGK